VVSADWNAARIAADLGAFYALHKPIDLLELLAAVNRALSQERSPEAH
jgi:DNA-binding NtrC family response regulator